MELNLKFIAIILVFFVIVFAIFSIVNDKINPKTGAVVYKSPTCGCCEGFIYELKKNFDVDVKIMENLSNIKNKYNIPSEMESCHTSIIGDYFVEGILYFVFIDFISYVGIISTSKPLLSNSAACPTQHPQVGDL